MTDFFKSHIISCVFVIIGIIMIFIFAESTGMSGDFQCLLVITVILFFLLWFLATYFKEKRRFEKFKKIKEQFSEKYLLGEIIPEPVDSIEMYYFDIIKSISSSAIEKVEKYGRESREYEEYVQKWVHEMRTPLTACSLILANDADRRKLQRELKKADNLTESILYHARLGSYANDIKMSRFSIAEVANEAVKEQAELLIGAKTAVDIDGDSMVYSDRKAIKFIIKQLLINNAKYCKGCHIKINIYDTGFTVHDNGPGIPSHELSRVTQRGFTGSNAVSSSSGTGMGLYIVDNLCKMLGAELVIKSVYGSHTDISVIFSNLTKM